MNQQLNRQYQQLPANIVLHQQKSDLFQDRSQRYIDFYSKIEQKPSSEITKIAQRAKKLAAKNRELRKVNRQLESFAHTVSHDLQEPLRSISLFTELLKEEYTEKLDSQGQEYLDFILSSTARMQTLVCDILAYSKITKNEETWLDIDLNQLVNSINEDLQSIVRETNAEIIVDNLPTVLVNATEIRQLFYNLIINSLKFKSDRQPQIKIASKWQHNGWLITVEDNGIGIETEYQQKIFQPFTRLHSQEQYSGNGIGLATCKKIVERYQGTIGVNSQLGKGSTFYFTLPQYSRDPR